MPARPYYRIQSVQHAAEVLKAFQPEHSVWGVTDLSRALGLRKTIVHRLLLTLEEAGMVQKDLETGGYRLGLEAFRIGMAYLGQWNLPEDSGRHLRRLMSDLDMAAHLAVLHGNRVIYVHVVHPPRYNGPEFDWAGQPRLPQYSALGKILLAWLPAERRAGILESLAFEPRTPHTIVGRPAFEQHLESVRRQGYALDDEEAELGWRCVAAPVFDFHRQVVAAISITGTCRQLSPAHLPDVVEHVRHSALRLSEQLGFEAANDEAEK